MAFIQNVCRQQAQYVRIAAGTREDVLGQERGLHFFGGARCFQTQQEACTLHAGDGADDAARADVGRYLADIGQQGSDSMVSMTASATAQAMGPPPNVV